MGFHLLIVVLALIKISKADNILNRSFIENSNQQEHHVLSNFTKLLGDKDKLDKPVNISLRSSRIIGSYDNYNNGGDYGPEKTDQTYSEICPYAEKPYCDFDYMYRTMDGSCNNQLYPWWGKSATPFKRVLSPVYHDGVQEPRKKSYSGKRLPNPRLIALKLHQPRKNLLDERISNLVPHMCQFLDHDLTLTALAEHKKDELVKCTCEDENKECINIPTPPEDVLNRDQKCMVTQRSEASHKKFNCDFGYREQLNLLSHWMDLSQIYGNDEKTGKKLRFFKGGRMNVSTIARMKRNYLRFDTKSKCTNVKAGEPCFLSSDVRVHQNSILTALLTMWTREHNRVADILVKLNKHWDDEKIYQEARKIVIGQYQHIIYNELLPILIGRKKMKSFGLVPMKGDEYFNGYDNYIYAHIANEFSTAAFRFGHTLVRNSLDKVDIDYKPFATHTLNEIIFNPGLAFKRGGLDSFVRGCLTNPVSYYDSELADVLTNHLFEGLSPKSDTHRFSLPALNINRGRDHGLRPYVDYRALCGYNYPKKFSELDNIPDDVVKIFKELYDDVYDIDLFPGGISEEPEKDALVGPTFACILANQFRDLKYGDRFYYENGSDKLTRFSRPQLKEIRKASMARILCDNIDVKYLQENPFFIRNEKTNPLIECEKIESMNYEEWKERKQEKYDNYEAASYY